MLAQTGGMRLRSQSRELGASPKCHSMQSGLWTGYKHSFTDTYANIAKQGKGLLKTRNQKSEATKQREPAEKIHFYCLF